MQYLDTLRELFNEKPEYYRQKTGDDEIWQRFLTRYPADKLTELSLDDYCLGKDTKEGNFSWWLEIGLRSPIGHYHPGTARGHVLYRMQSGELYKVKELADLDDEAALAYLLKVTQLLATAPDLEAARKYDDNKVIYSELGIEPRATMGSGRKLRVFLAYHPDKMVPISSVEHLTHFLRILPGSDAPLPKTPFALAIQLFERYQEVSESCSGLTPFGFMRLLYDDRLGIVPKPRTAIGSGESKRTWLLTWNPANMDWESLDQDRETIR